MERADEMDAVLLRMQAHSFSSFTPRAKLVQGKPSLLANDPFLGIERFTVKSSHINLVVSILSFNYITESDTRCRPRYSVQQDCTLGLFYFL